MRRELRSSTSPSSRKNSRALSVRTSHSIRDPIADFVALPAPSDAYARSTGPLAVCISLHRWLSWHSVPSSMWEVPITEAETHRPADALIHLPNPPESRGLQVEPDRLWSIWKQPPTNLRATRKDP